MLYFYESKPIPIPLFQISCLPVTEILISGDDQMILQTDSYRLQRALNLLCNFIVIIRWFRHTTGMVMCNNHTDGAIF